MSEKYNTEHKEVTFPVLGMNVPCSALVTAQSTTKGSTIAPASAVAPCSAQSTTKGIPREQCNFLRAIATMDASPNALLFNAVAVPNMNEFLFNMAENYFALSIPTSISETLDLLYIFSAETFASILKAERLARSAAPVAGMAANVVPVPGIAPANVAPGGAPRAQYQTISYGQDTVFYLNIPVHSIGSGPLVSEKDIWIRPSDLQGLWNEFVSVFPRTLECKDAGLTQEDYNRLASKLQIIPPTGAQNGAIIVYW